MPNLEAIVAENADVVWRIACQLLSNEDDARDCYQQTFLDAMRLEAKSVKDWRSMLCRITTRRAMDLLRKRYRDREVFPRSAEEPHQDNPPDKQLMNDEFREEVRQALATLPTQQAEAFWLRHIEQLPPTEIADQLNVQPGHVRVLVHRAAKHLRITLKANYGAITSEGD